MRLDRDVAVAVVKTDGLDDAGRHRITREARAMARLGDHPNIVTVFDVGEDAGVPYIVSEFMPGGSVADLMDAHPDGSVSVDDALRIASEITLALEHAHSMSIIHRDLKPANVWLAADGAARLGDFGLAVDVDRSRMTSEGMVVGTVAYLAPEQAVGRAPDSRSDLYALGATLYELLTGRPPFLGDDAVGVISQHLSTAPVAPSWHNEQVTRPIEVLVLDLLAKDPAARPQTATAVLATICRLRDQTSESTPPGPAAPDPARAASVPFGRLVGRVAELGQLTTAFDETSSGRGRLLLVVGEPGIGKTRLTEELAVYGSVRGAKTLWGHCYEGELGVPYLPFVEALRSYTRNRPDDVLRAELGTGAPEVATLVSELRQRFPDLPASPALEGDAERLRLFESVATFLRNAATIQPIVLMLDDLHWADKPSLMLMQHLARNLRRDRVMIVGTYRDVELERTHPLADTVAALRRERLFERVLLRGLPADDVLAFIEAFGDQETPPEFAAMIHRETEGNPFFVTEILRYLAESGALQRVAGRWVGSSQSVADNLPEGIREVIGRRLDRLSDECNRMLTVGAAMPGGFQMEVCAVVTDFGEDAVLDLLDEALERQIIRERRDTSGTYEFTHALIRQTLYGELSTPRRVRLHRQIAEALETLYESNIDAHLGVIAYHCFQGAPGGDVAKAVDYATRAAERASAQAGHEEAARYYDMALQALELSAESDGAHRSGLLLSQGQSLRQAGDANGATTALHEAAGLARGLDDAVLFARIALAAASMTWLGTSYREDLASLIAEALERLGDQDLALKAHLVALQALHIVLLDVDGSRLLATQAVDLARRSGDPGAIAQALLASAMTLTGPEATSKWRPMQDEVARLATLAGDSNALFGVLHARVIRAVMEQDRREFDQQLAALGAFATQSRSPFYIASELSARAVAASMDGDFAQAEALSFEVLELGRRIQDPSVVANAGIGLFPGWRERGRLGSLVAATSEVVAGAGALDSWRAGLAQMLLETGAADGAAELLGEVGIDGFSHVPDDVARRYTLCTLAEVAATLEDVERCAQLYELLLPEAGKASFVGAVSYHGSVDRFLGLSALTLGRHDDAVAHLEEALAIHVNMRARPWVARTRYDLGRALLVRDHVGDRERGVALLNEALDTATKLEMSRLVDEILAVKLALQGISSDTIMSSIDAVAAGVRRERPDLSLHTDSSGQVTIVFSDIERYTEMTERLGDSRSQEVLRAHNTILRAEVANHRGTEVKSAGDGFMLAFTRATDALECARAIQRGLAAGEVGGERIRVRMGLHTGDVIREEDDFFGRTVILAARVAAFARGGEVLLTDAVRNAVGRDEVWGASQEVPLKGLSGTHRVTLARW